MESFAVMGGIVVLAGKYRARATVFTSITFQEYKTTMQM